MNACLGGVPLVVGGADDEGRGSADPGMGWGSNVPATTSEEGGAKVITMACGGTCAAAELEVGGAELVAMGRVTTCPVTDRDEGGAELVVGNPALDGNTTKPVAGGAGVETTTTECRIEWADNNHQKYHISRAHISLLPKAQLVDGMYSLHLFTHSCTKPYIMAMSMSIWRAQKAAYPQA